MEQKSNEGNGNVKADKHKEEVKREIHFVG